MSKLAMKLVKTNRQVVKKKGIKKGERQSKSIGKILRSLFAWQSRPLITGMLHPPPLLHQLLDYISYRINNTKSRHVT